ncbi:RNA binding motif protein 25a [Balamuthia mandrillaris]
MTRTQKQTTTKATREKERRERDERERQKDAREKDRKTRESERERERERERRGILQQHDKDTHSLYVRSAPPPSSMTQNPRSSGGPRTSEKGKTRPSRVDPISIQIL